jgi:NarL family two-component system response regulator LiaR
MTETITKPIRVMIVDDHLMVRKGLGTFLKAYDDMEMVGEAENGLKAIELCERAKPDVILMDIMMPEMDGVATTRAIIQKFPQMHVLAITSYADLKLMQSILQAGAIGYMLKDVSAEELARAVRLAANGKGTLSSEAAQMLVNGANHHPSIGHDLTDREREVLHWMIKGLNNTQIAGKLVVSPSTIKSHVSNILSKLHVASRTEAVALAVHDKIVP